MAQRMDLERVDVGHSADGGSENRSPSTSFGDAVADGRKPWLRGYGAVGLVVLGLIVAGAVAISVSGVARQQLALSFIPQPERYTELYFSGERPVDSVADAAGESVQVRFTIANREGRAEALRYTVRVVDDAEGPLSDVPGSVQLENDGVTTISATVPLPFATRWSAVEVTLDGRPERLRFLRTQADAMAR